MSHKHTRHTVGTLAAMRQSDIDAVLVKKTMQQKGDKETLNRIAAMEDPILKRQAMKIYNSAWVTN